MIADIFSATVIIGILTSGIRLATPYLYAAIGETFGQRSGVLNLGVDGQMLIGAFAAFYVAFTTGNLWLGLLAAMGVGALMGLAMAYVTVNLHAQQDISGIKNNPAKKCGSDIPGIGLGQVSNKAPTIFSYAPECECKNQR